LPKLINLDRERKIDPFDIDGDPIFRLAHTRLQKTLLDCFIYFFSFLKDCLE